jgi:hypothetical protein
MPRKPVELPVPAPWPSNLAWRIRLKRYCDAEYFLDFRRDKAFAMPFRNWESIFHKLTLKAPAKIKFMPTEVIIVPPDAMVGDMKYIDAAYMFIIKNDPSRVSQRRREPMLDRYVQTMIPYTKFMEDPTVFEHPEIMIDRSSMQVLPFRVAAVTVPDGKKRTTILTLVKKPARPPSSSET